MGGRLGIDCLQTIMKVWHLQTEKRSTGRLVRRASDFNAPLRKSQPGVEPNQGRGGRTTANHSELDSNSIWKDTWISSNKIL